MKDGKYEEALERARQGLPIDKIFPELKESEDERIRKWLIEMVEELRKANPTHAEYNGDCSEAIAYLEKQKEHKPEIKYVYPIFKVGDTIKPKAYNQNHRIDKIKDDNYVLDNGFTFPIVGQDVWEIVEQKPVKLNDDTEVGLDRALQIVKNAKGNLCGYQSDDGIYECNHAIQTLERILKSGIKQQPAEWSEEDKKMLEAIVGDIHCGTNFNAEVMREANIREKWLRERLKSLRPYPHWKPSEEQINALQAFVGMIHPDARYNAVSSLLDELKAL